MAKLSGSGNTKSVKVEKGDTLSQIAKTYASDTYPKNASYKELASWNGIKNADLIYPGQIIKLYNPKTTSSSTSSNPLAVTITSKTSASDSGLKLKSDSNDTLFITWSYSGAKIKGYRLEWQTSTKGKNGPWSAGKTTDTAELYGTYTLTDMDKAVRVRVCPVDTSDRTLNWTGWQLYGKGRAPAAPPVPELTLDGLTMTMSVSNVGNDAYAVYFQHAENNVAQPKTRPFKVATSSASHTVTKLKAGTEYKVRCYAIGADDQVSLPSGWSNVIRTIPSAPQLVKDNVVPATRPSLEGESFQLTWSEVASATSYEVQYTTDKTLFDVSDQVQSKTAETSTLIISGLTRETTYYFRVRSKNETGESAWSEIVDQIIAHGPAAPTTWSSSTVIGCYDPLILYWMHNSEDGTFEKAAMIKITLNGVEIVSDTIDKNQSEAERGITSSYEFKMVDDLGKPYYPNGGTLRWCVKTCGTSGVYSEDWSETRVVEIYTQPTLGMKVEGPEGIILTSETAYVVNEVFEGIFVTTDQLATDLVGQPTEMEDTYTVDTNTQVLIGTDSDGNYVYYCVREMRLTAFPITVTANPTPTTGNQEPIGYRITIASNGNGNDDGYYTSVDEVGNIELIADGSVIYAKNFDESDQLNAVISAGDVKLENGVTYTLKCTVIMSSGLTAEATHPFQVLWNEETKLPSADVTIDTDTLSATIHPYCATYYSEYRKVSMIGGRYIKSEMVISGVYGDRVPDATTTTGEQVYYGTFDDGTTGYYCTYEYTVVHRDVILEVYRREYDGSFTLIAGNLDGDLNNTIVDPHPSLDYARYRIVATSKNTGAVTYCDTPGYPVGGKELVLQWDEPWTNFDEYVSDDTPIQLEGSGSIVKLPYNIDITSKNDPDVSLIKYIGRKNPVSYYGTQVGESQTWNTVIDREDKATLYALRRLSAWAGDVYVREPSGMGYWANVTVSFSQRHNDLTIPITFNITRVEGGV